MWARKFSKKYVNFMLAQAFPGQNQIVFLLNESRVSPLTLRHLFHRVSYSPIPYTDFHTCISGVKGKLALL